MDMPIPKLKRDTTGLRVKCGSILRSRIRVEKSGPLSYTTSTPSPEFATVMVMRASRGLVREVFLSRPRLLAPALEVRLFVLTASAAWTMRFISPPAEFGGVSEDGRISSCSHTLNTVDTVRGQSQDIIDSPPNINHEIVGIRACVSLQGLGRK